MVDNTAIALGDAAKSMIMGVAVIRRDLRIAHAITSPFQPFSTMRRHANRSGSMLFVFVRQQRLGRLFVIVSRYRAGESAEDCEQEEGDWVGPAGLHG